MKRDSVSIPIPTTNFIENYLLSPNTKDMQTTHVTLANMSVTEKSLHEVLNALIKAKDEDKPAIAKDVIPVYANYLDSEDLEDIMIVLGALKEIKEEEDNGNEDFGQQVQDHWDKRVED